MKTDFRKEVTFTLPNVISNDVIRLALDNFGKQGFDAGSTFKTWKPLKASTAKEKLRRHQGKVSNILVDSGRGRQAVAASRRPPSVMGNKIILNFNVAAPYMQYHNYGVKGRLPQRQFIGTSEKLQNVIHMRVRNMFEDLMR